MLYFSSWLRQHAAAIITLSDWLSLWLVGDLSCRLSLEQLAEAAHDREQRKAYHTHLAPWPAAEQQAAAAAAAAAGTRSADQQEHVLGNGVGILTAPADHVLLAQLQDVMAQ
jgi:hypothetical protein